MKKIVIIIISVFMLSMSINAIDDTELSIGTKVKYKDILFYVIGNSDDTIKLLKAEPLTYDEVTLYGKVGLDDQHVNNIYGEVINQANYGGMAYISSNECYDDNSEYICTNEYSKSDVKYVIDNWYNDKINSDIIKEVRIPSVVEISSLGYEKYYHGTYYEWEATDDTPSWVNSGNYFYWITTDSDSNQEYCGVMTEYIGCNEIIKSSYIGVVRPVIVVNKKSRK